MPAQSRAHYGIYWLSRWFWPALKHLSSASRDVLRQRKTSAWLTPISLPSTPSGFCQNTVLRKLLQQRFRLCRSPPCPGHARGAARPDQTRLGREPDSVAAMLLPIPSQAFRLGPGGRRATADTNSRHCRDRLSTRVLCTSKKPTMTSSVVYFAAPAKIVCVGLNYVDHAAERASSRPTTRRCSAASPRA